MHGKDLNRDDGPVRKGLARTVQWSHVAAALVAFSTDVVKPIADHCPTWVAIGALVAFICLLVLRHRRGTESEVISSAIVFCVTTVLLSALVICLEHEFGGEHGSFVERIPGIENLQRHAGIIESKLDTVGQTVDRLEHEQKQQHAMLSQLQQITNAIRRAENVTMHCKFSDGRETDWDVNDRRVLFNGLKLDTAINITMNDDTVSWEILGANNSLQHVVIFRNSGFANWASTSSEFLTGRCSKIEAR